MQNIDLLKALVLTLCKVVPVLGGNAGSAIRTLKMRSVMGPYTTTGYIVKEKKSNPKEKKCLHAVSTFKSFPFLQLTLHDLTHHPQSLLLKQISPIDLKDAFTDSKVIAICM